MEILKKQTNWENLYFYQKTVVLYQMTVVFCQRFLPKYGDRTVDQMVQAARSGKQNIVEGFADGVTSTEMELKLLNVARASIKELKEDYLDYLSSHHLALWRPKLHPRYDAMLKFCRAHNMLEDYAPHFKKWSDEEFANCANTLCHMVDRMLATHLARKAEDFKENGGIKERMTAVRLGRRKTQNDEISALKAENAVLKTANVTLKTENVALKTGNAAMKSEIEALKTEITALRVENVALKTENAAQKSKIAKLHAASESGRIRQASPSIIASASSPARTTSPSSRDRR